MGPCGIPARQDRYRRGLSGGVGGVCGVVGVSDLVWHGGGDLDGEAGAVSREPPTLFDHRIRCYLVEDVPSPAVRRSFGFRSVAAATITLATVAGSSPPLVFFASTSSKVRRPAA